MSDRIVELVKRARRVYGDDAVLDSYEAEGDATFWSVRVGTRVVLHVVGDNAQDALEAALLVLVGDLVLTGEERSLMRPDIEKVIKANVEVGMAYTTLLCAVDQLAQEWEAEAAPLAELSSDYDLASARTLVTCADELRARAKQP